MYRIEIIYLDGTLQGMEISRSVSTKYEIGKIYTDNISGSHYKVLSCEEE